ncbi:MULTISPECIES: glycosyltransferase family 9 protein [Vibrio]|uniref:glycosyltransferase family 9 protein n=1 Tax=Vibrio TaxID=662 RepID=UPI0013A626EE|nr:MULTISPECIES: glycosyltransferase family 9 protein [Vibrio]
MALYKKVISNILNIRKNKLSSIDTIPNNPCVIIDATFNIGDYMAISPIIEAVMLQWENPKITILCTSKNEDAVKFDDRVDYICLPDKKKWLQYPAILKEKLNRPIDLLIEPASLDLPYRSIIGFIIKPDLTIGLEPEKYKCIQNPKETIIKNNISQPQIYSNMMKAYGFKETQGVFKVYEDKTTHRKIQSNLDNKNITDYIVFNPFASIEKRSWDIGKSKNFLTHYLKKGGDCLLLLPTYIENKDSWERELKEICNVFHVESIQESIYLIKNAKGVVSVDTSIVHIASAYNVPTVGIYHEKSFNRKEWHPQSDKSMITCLDWDVDKIIDATTILN